MSPRPHTAREEGGPGPGRLGNVRALPRAADDALLVERLRNGDARAQATFYDRFSELVERILVRVLGMDRELDDLHHDVFVQAIESVRKLRDPAALRAWVISVTVNTAHATIRRRQRWRWIALWREAEPPAAVARARSPEAAEAVRATYAVLETLPADERVAFALRHVEGMELTEAAAACGVSLATIKRRLARAEERFRVAAGAHPVLEEWMEGGGRWTSPRRR
ncbi:MAG TPA: sigma-70 family RNA polymerase sigma factor [Myxococcota bacterium]|nr:sigma-70 family RNA polymerase sigma factor [Myxococcota bacterium]